MPDHSGFPLDSTYEQAKSNALKALELDDSLAEEHTSLAELEFLAGNAPAAEKEFRRALQLDPSYPNAHHSYGLFLGAYPGRIQEAIMEFNRALDFDPLSVPIHCNAAMGYVSAGQLNKAQELLDEASKLDPNSIFVHGSLGIIYSRMGRHGESAAEFKRAADLTGGLSSYTLEAIVETALAGDKRRALKMLNPILDRAEQKPPDPSAWAHRDYVLALACVRLGQNQRAFYWLDRALSEHVTTVAAVEAEPQFDGLRSDLQWVAIRSRFAKK